MGSNKDRKLTDITGEDDDCMLDGGQFRGNLASSRWLFRCGLKLLSIRQRAFLMIMLESDRL